MNLGLVTAVWKRPAVTRFCLNYVSSLKGITHYAASYSDPMDFASIPDHFMVTQVPNKPLGAKWNDACQLLQGRVDGILIMGSDDIITQEAVDAHGEHLFSALGTLYVYDTATRATIHLNRGRMGAGRFVAAELLDRCNWRPWEDGLNKSLDRSVEISVGMKPELVKGRNVHVLDIKSQTNIWSFQHLDENVRSERVSTEGALKCFGLTMADMP